MRVQINPIVVTLCFASTVSLFAVGMGPEPSESMTDHADHPLAGKAHEEGVVGPAQPPQRWRPLQLEPGQRLSVIDGTISGRSLRHVDTESVPFPRRVTDDRSLVTAFPTDVVVRRIGEMPSSDVVAGEQEETLLYSNFSNTILFAPGAGRTIADDFSVFTSTTCLMTAYEVMVSGGGNGTGAGFSVDVALYDGCPNDGGVVIAGSAQTYDLPDDGVFTIRHDFSGEGRDLPMEGWMQISFSTAQAGIPIGMPAEIGFTDDVYDFPTVPCEASFGPTLYAGFYLKVFGSSTCEPFAPTQVNVDEFGVDIPFDAGNEPSIAVDPTDPNRMAIGWRQFDTINNSFRQAGFAFSEDGGDSWTFPGVIEPGIFRSDPVLDFDADGNFYYNSLTTVNGFTTDSFTSIDGGKTWGKSAFAFGGDKQWVAIDRTDSIGRGHIYQGWSLFAGCCGNRIFNRSTDGGVTFEEPVEIQFSPRFGTLSVGPDGELYVAGVVNGPTVAIARSDSAKDADRPVVFEQVVLRNFGGVTGGIGGGPNPAGLLGQVWIATDHSKSSRRGNVYLLSSVVLFEDDPMDVHFLRSEDGGATFSNPLRVNSDPPVEGSWQWMATMSVAPSGRIDVVWLDTRATLTDNLCELYYTFSIDAGETWSEERSMTPIFDSHRGWPQQNKMGDYFDMISHDDYAYLTYSATFTGGQDVYFLKIPADCNENGVPDVDEIKAGSAADCNGNLALDICEPQDDCDQNGVLDICELDEVDADCNNNSVLDICESADDCNNNGIQDICDLFLGVGEDCNENSIIDSCEVADGSVPDCNNNLRPDACDLNREGDCNNNSIPDSCDLASCDGDPACDDCNGNQRIDACDLTNNDCNFNSVPDDCESAADCNNNQFPDICDIAVGLVPDCNDNLIPDACDIEDGNSSDCGWGPSNCCEEHDSPGCTNPEVEACVCAFDPLCCQADQTWNTSCVLVVELAGCGDCGTLLGGNGVPDECDIADGLVDDCNLSGTPDACDIAFDLTGDGFVDLVDYSAFYECIISDGEGPASPCCFFEQTGDGVIGLPDFAGLQNSFGE
ncbi:MAG: hypothetical protein ACPGXK_07110 [Phycisphaerae bacterium]